MSSTRPEPYGLSVSEVRFFLSEGDYDEQTIHAEASEQTSFTLIYRAAGSDTTVAFKTNPGQTVWIGKDRVKARFATKTLQIDDDRVLEKHASDESLHAIGSLEELQTPIAKLKGEQKD